MALTMKDKDVIENDRAKIVGKDSGNIGLLAVCNPPVNGTSSIGAPDDSPQQLWIHMPTENQTNSTSTTCNAPMRLPDLSQTLPPPVPPAPKRKSSHNSVEKLRKEKIRTCINNIGQQVPPCKAGEKEGTLSVLERAYEYILDLKEKLNRCLLEQADQVQAEEIKLLRSNVERLRLEKNELEVALKNTCTTFSKRGKVSGQRLLQQTEALTRATSENNDSLDGQTGAAASSSIARRQKTVSACLEDAEAHAMQDSQSSLPIGGIPGSMALAGARYNPLTGQVIPSPNQPFSGNVPVGSLIGSGNPFMMSSSDGMQMNMLASGILASSPAMSQAATFASQNVFASGEKPSLEAVSLLQLAMQDAGITSGTAKGSKSSSGSGNTSNSSKSKSNKSSKSKPDKSQSLAESPASTAPPAVTTTPDSDALKTETISNSSLISSQNSNTILPPNAGAELQMPSMVVQNQNVGLNMNMVQNGPLSGLMMGVSQQQEQQQQQQQQQSQSQQPIIYINEQGIPIMTIPSQVQTNDMNSANIIPPHANISGVIHTDGRISHNNSQNDTTIESGLSDSHNTVQSTDGAIMAEQSDQNVQQQQQQQQQQQHHQHQQQFLNQMVSGGMLSRSTSQPLPCSNPSVVDQSMSAPQGPNGMCLNQLVPGVTGPGGMCIMNSAGIAPGNANAGSVVLPVSQNSNFLSLNTTPTVPNQLPSALILPNGQIIPVVTQPNLLINSAANSNPTFSVAPGFNPMQQTGISGMQGIIAQPPQIPGGILTQHNLAQMNQIPSIQQTIGLPGQQQQQIIAANASNGMPMIGNNFVMTQPNVSVQIQDSNSSLNMNNSNSNLSSDLLDNNAVNCSVTGLLMTASSVSESTPSSSTMATLSTTVVPTTVTQSVMSTHVQNLLSSSMAKQNADAELCSATGTNNGSPMTSTHIMDGSNTITFHGQNVSAGLSMPPDMNHMGLIGQPQAVMGQIMQQSNMIGQESQTKLCAVNPAQMQQSADLTAALSINNSGCNISNGGQVNMTTGFPQPPPIIGPPGTIVLTMQSNGQMMNVIVEPTTMQVLGMVPMQSPGPALQQQSTVLQQQATCLQKPLAAIAQQQQQPMMMQGTAPSMQQPMMMQGTVTSMQQPADPAGTLAQSSGSKSASKKGCPKTLKPKPGSSIPASQTSPVSATSKKSSKSSSSKKKAASKKASESQQVSADSTSTISASCDGILSSVDSPSATTITTTTSMTTTITTTTSMTAAVVATAIPILANISHSPTDMTDTVTTSSMQVVNTGQPGEFLQLPDIVTPNITGFYMQREDSPLSIETQLSRNVEGQDLLKSPLSNASEIKSPQLIITTNESVTSIGPRTPARENKPGKKKPQTAKMPQKLGDQANVSLMSDLNTSLKPDSSFSVYDFATEENEMPTIIVPKATGLLALTKSPAKKKSRSSKAANKDSTKPEQQEQQIGTNILSPESFDHQQIPVQSTPKNKKKSGGKKKPQIKNELSTTMSEQTSTAVVIPETIAFDGSIRFSESELSDVLDQVERLGETIAEDIGSADANVEQDDSKEKNSSVQSKAKGKSKKTKSKTEDGEPVTKKRKKNKKVEAEDGKELTDLVSHDTASSQLTDIEALANELNTPTPLQMGEMENEPANDSSVPINETLDMSSIFSTATEPTKSPEASFLKDSDLSGNSPDYLMIDTGETMDLLPGIAEKNSVKVSPVKKQKNQTYTTPESMDFTDPFNTMASEHTDQPSVTASSMEGPIMSPVSASPKPLNVSPNTASAEVGLKRFSPLNKPAPEQEEANTDEATDTDALFNSFLDAGVHDSDMFTADSSNSKAPPFYVESPGEINTRKTNDESNLSKKTISPAFGDESSTLYPNSVDSVSLQTQANSTSATNVFSTSTVNSQLPYSAESLFSLTADVQSRSTNVFDTNEACSAGKESVSVRSGIFSAENFVQQQNQQQQPNTSPPKALSGKITEIDTNDTTLDNFSNPSKKMVENPTVPNSTNSVTTTNNSFDFANIGLNISSSLPTTTKVSDSSSASLPFTDTSVFAGPRPMNPTNSMPSDTNSPFSLNLMGTPTSEPRTSTQNNSYTASSSSAPSIDNTLRAPNLGQHQFPFYPIHPSFSSQSPGNGMPNENLAVSNENSPVSTYQSLQLPSQPITNSRPQQSRPLSQSSPNMETTSPLTHPPYSATSPSFTITERNTRQEAPHPQRHPSGQSNRLNNSVKSPMNPSIQNPPQHHQNTYSNFGPYHSPFGSPVEQHQGQFQKQNMNNSGQKSQDNRSSVGSLPDVSTASARPQQQPQQQQPQPQPQPQQQQQSTREFRHPSPAGSVNAGRIPQNLGASGTSVPSPDTLHHSPRMSAGITSMPQFYGASSEPYPASCLNTPPLHHPPLQQSSDERLLQRPYEEPVFPPSAMSLGHIAQAYSSARQSAPISSQRNNGNNMPRRNSGNPPMLAHNIDMTVNKASQQQQHPQQSNRGGKTTSSSTSSSKPQPSSHMTTHNQQSQSQGNTSQQMNRQDPKQQHMQQHQQSSGLMSSQSTSRGHQSNHPHTPPSLIAQPPVLAAPPLSHQPPTLSHPPSSAQSQQNPKSQHTASSHHMQQSHQQPPQPNRQSNMSQNHMSSSSSANSLTSNTPSGQSTNSSSNTSQKSKPPKKSSKKASSSSSSSASLSSSKHLVSSAASSIHHLHNPFGMEPESSLPPHALFDSNRSMTPYFPIPNLSPPPVRNMQNEGPMYMPAHNFFGASRQLSNPNSAMHKGSELGAPFNQLFAPPPSRGPQNGLGLNFAHQGMAGGLGMNPMNPMHHASAHQLSQHSNNMANHHAGPMPSFSLSNIFSDVSQSDAGLSISPIKFSHSNPILQGQPPGMDHNALDPHTAHHQAGSFYHNRGPTAHHPPPGLHNAMAINSLLGNGHGFDPRSVGPGGAMGPAFHGPGHPSSFAMPPLNFTMHDH